MSEKITRLFVYLKFSALYNLSTRLPELENVYTAKEICEIDAIFLVAQIEFIYFFAEEIK